VIIFWIANYNFIGKYAGRLVVLAIHGKKASVSGIKGNVDGIFTMVRFYHR
jgi:hypothetical protein